MNLLHILAIYGLYFLFAESNGPFDIISNFRQKLFNNSIIGVFFFKLFECAFCLGCWCGGFIFLISETWNLNNLILWFLGGGSINLIIKIILEKINNA